MIMSLLSDYLSKDGRGNKTKEDEAIGSHQGLEIKSGNSSQCFSTQFH